MRLSAACREYQRDVQDFAEKHAPAKPLDGHIEAEVTFYLKRLDGQKNRVYPNTKPDLDNITKSLMDAMERAGFIANDSRIVTLTLKKRFVGDGVHQPGAQVRFQVH